MLVTLRAQRAGPNLHDISGQCCCKLQLKLLAWQRRKLFIEFVTAKRLVCKNGHSLVEPPSRVFYTVSVSAYLFVGERFFHMLTGARSRRPHRSHFSHGRQNRRSSFCSGRGENLVTIARFGKPFFADMHHRVHAVAGALWKPNVACPHPDVSTG